MLEGQAKDAINADGAMGAVCWSAYAVGREFAVNLNIYAASYQAYGTERTPYLFAKSPCWLGSARTLSR